MKILQSKVHPSGLLIVQLHYATTSLISAIDNSPSEFVENHCPSKNGLGAKGLIIVKIVDFGSSYHYIVGVLENHFTQLELDFKVPAHPCLILHLSFPSKACTIKMLQYNKLLLLTIYGSFREN